MTYVPHSGLCRNILLFNSLYKKKKKRGESGFICLSVSPLSIIKSSDTESKLKLLKKVQ